MYFREIVVFYNLEYGIQVCIHFIQSCLSLLGRYFYILLFERFRIHHTFLDFRTVGSFHKHIYVYIRMLVYKFIIEVLYAPSRQVPHGNP